MSLRLIKIFQAPENRLALEQELLWGEKLCDECWNAQGEDVTEPGPFPFIATCVVIGAGWDPEDGYQHMVHIYPFNMFFDKGDNNDGITVIDITDLDNVKQCFVVFTGDNDNYDSEEESDDNNESGHKDPREQKTQAPKWTPLKASQYLRSYYPEKILIDDLNIMDQFSDKKLIAVSALNSCWPYDWEENPDRMADVTLPSPSFSTPTLRSTTLMKVIDEAFGSTQPTYILERAGLLSDFLPTIKGRIFENPESALQSPGSLPLLKTVIQGNLSIDLSPLNLTAKQLTQLLVEGGVNTNVTTLSLSGNLHLSAALLENILTNHPNLRTLYILNTSQIPLNTKLSLVKNTAITTLYTSELFDAPFIFFSTKERNGEQWPLAHPYSFPLSYCRSPVSQILYLSTGRATSDPSFHCLGDSPGIDFSKIKFPFSLKEDGSKIEQVRMGDAFWLSYTLADLDHTPIAFLSSFAGLLLLFTHENSSLEYDSEQASADFNILIAMAFGAVDEKGGKESWKVVPLSDKLYRRLNSYFNYWHGKRMPDVLERGKWTVVFVVEPFWARTLSVYETSYESLKGKKSSAVRYAFLGAKDDVEGRVGDSEVVGVGAEEWLGIVMPGDEVRESREGAIKRWNEALKSVKGNQIEVCSKEEIEGIVKARQLKLLNVYEGDEAKEAEKKMKALSID